MQIILIFCFTLGRIRSIKEIKQIVGVISSACRLIVLVAMILLKAKGLLVSNWVWVSVLVLHIPTSSL